MRVTVAPPTRGFLSHTTRERELIAHRILRRAVRSIVAARIAIATVFATHVLAVAVGVVAGTSGNALAVEQRDAVVGASRSSAITIADRSGDHVQAALLDAGSNLVAGASSTVVGISVVGVYPLVAYRGWIGGIVVLDATHESRLNDPVSALYYLVTILLQLIPYSISGGLGVRLGVGAWRQIRSPSGNEWLGLPRDRLIDALCGYAVIAPLFLVASLFEFLVRV